MKIKSIFYKLFSTYFFISLIGLLIVLLISRYSYQNFYYNEVSKNLIKNAKLVENKIIRNLKTKDSLKLSEDILYISKVLDVRLTLMNLEGKVLADTAADHEDLDNHISRKEIEEALDHGVGESRRFSDTLGISNLYIAILLEEKGVHFGFLRMAISTKRLGDELSSLTDKILIWSFVLLIFLTYFIYSGSRKISSPLVKMKEDVEEFAKGDLKIRIKNTNASSLEVQSLSNAIGEMSEKIQEQFNKIITQKNEQVAVFSSMLEGVVTIYPDMKIHHINDAAMKLFNYQGTVDLKGVPLENVIKSEYIYEVARKLLEEKRSINNEFEYETGIILNVHGTILKSEEIGMLGGVLVFNDISKIRKLENHRKEFVDNVSHELKTPLTSILGYLETLINNNDIDSLQQKKFLTIIDKQSKRLKQIVDDLLALSSLEKEGRVDQLELQSITTQKILEGAYQLAKPIVEDKNIKVEINCDDHVVQCNKPLIEQALINLIENAAKYGPKDSKITLSGKLKNSFYEFSVTDIGPGIASEHHERLFERFYSANKARSRELGGSGLGLSIVKHIALSHKGNVRVESEVSKGSTFVISIPI